MVDEQVDVLQDEVGRASRLINAAKRRRQQQAEAAAVTGPGRKSRTGQPLDETQTAEVSCIEP